MFVDIHNHIIPKVDDGARDADVALAMLKTAEQEGISTIIATPHYIPGYNKYNNEILVSQYEKIIKIIQENNLNINLYLGNELAIDIDSAESLQQGTCLSLANSNYVLVELPHRFNYSVVENLLYSIAIKGYRIILAHVERYEIFRQSPELLKELLERGYYAQINASSIVTSDRRLKKFVTKLIVNNYVHFVATDSHSNGRRRPLIRQAYSNVKQLIGDRADNLFIQNGQKILKNEHIINDTPKKFKRFFWAGRGM